MFNIIDLFSGAGGLTEGFRLRNKYKFICHVEMDEDACSSLELRNIYYYMKENGIIEYYYDYIKGNIEKKKLNSLYPKEITQDILNLEISDNTIGKIFEFIDKKLGYEKLDGIIGGPPCQAYSIIGRSRNEAKKSTDERIYLYKYYLTFLKKYNPKFFVFENVKGLLSFKDVDGKRLFPKIIKEFNEHGYNVESSIVNAFDYGVSQKRERLILVGTRKDIELNNSFFEYLCIYKEKAPVLKELFSDLPKINAGECLNIYNGENNNKVVKKYIRNNDFNTLTYHISRANNKNDLTIYKMVSESKKKGINLRYNDLPQKLQTHSNKNSFLDRYKALDYNSVSHTVVAHIAKDGHYYIHPDTKQNRSITVREAARIQGFPDDFYFEHSRTAAFRQIGNAVPPILSKKIAMSLLDMFNKKK